MSPEDLKTLVKDEIEKYHQEHFWTLFPAGTIQPWVIEAVALFVKPLYEEIEMLKQTELVFAEKPAK